MPVKAHAPFGNQWWFTDEFADGPRRLMDGLAAVPEWSPSDEAHLLGSSSVVTKIAYGKGSVTYSTFDPLSIDVLRLNFTPNSVTSGGRQLTRHADLKQEGYTLDQTNNVLRVRHDRSRDIDIQVDPVTVAERITVEPVPLIVDFDNPHLGAGFGLQGQYPSGVIDWGEREWKTYPPEGRMSTFSLGTAQPDASSAQFRFASPKTLMRFDVYNPTGKEIVVKMRAPEMREITFHIKPGALQRIKTGWKNRASLIIAESEGLGSLRFDNLAYSPYLWTRLDWSE
jgi:hypothetical protein